MGSVQKEVDYDYDGYYNNLLDEYDYDWGAGAHGALLRHTNTVFLTTYQYTNAHLLNLFSTGKTYDGGNNLIAQWDQEYDQTTPSSCSGISSTGYDATVTPMGNPTTKRAWLNTTGNYLSTVFTYDITGNVTSIKDPNGNKTTYSYADPQNTYAHVTSKTDALAGTYTWSYDYSSGKLLQSTDLNNVTDVYSYADSTGALDPFDRVKTIAMASSTLSQDNTNVTYTSPTEVNIYVDQNTVNDEVLRTQNLYDGFGRILESRTYTSSSGYRSTPQTYDALGRVATIQNELGYLTQYGYDALGRNTSVQTLADSALVSTSYSGNVTTVTDQAGTKCQTTTDGLGRLTQVVEDPGGLAYTTGYKYDALGNLKEVDQASQKRQFSYDSLSRLVSATNPESGKISYTYDANGNVLTKADNAGTTTTYTFDALNRLLTKSYTLGAKAQAAATAAVTYSYCNPKAQCTNGSYGIGRLQSVTTGDGNKTLYTQYTALGQVQAHTQQNGNNSYPFTYSYASAGANLLQEVYPSGRQINFAYGWANEPLVAFGNFTTNGTTATTVYIGWMNFAGFKETYRSFGVLPADTMVLNRSYNAREQLTGLDLHNWNNTDNTPDYMQFSFQYGYGGSNNNGNLLSSSERNSPTNVAAPGTQLSPAVTQYYAYDTVNRLSSVTDSDYARSMCYDAYGNGWVTSSTGTYDALPGNAPSEIGVPCSSASSTPYLTASNQLSAETYDTGGTGNQTSFRGDTVTFDAENRVVAVTAPNKTVLATYSYDGDGQRVAKTVGGTTTNYVYDSLGRVLAEYVNGTLSKEYVRMHSSFISPSTELVAIENAPGTPNPCATKDGNGNPSTACFVISDDLGSVRMLGDVNGRIVSRHDFLPFGEEATPSATRLAAGGFGSTDNSTQRFTGKERDSESGLDYFGARYFGSALGRFTSPDPLMASAHASNPQSWNRYAYTLNNPLRFVDPDGMDVPAACAQDKNCQIAVKVNVIYDQTVNNGKGFTDEQKTAFESDQIAKAQKDFGNSDIKLDVTYTKGSYTVDDNGQTHITGLDKGALNIVASTATPFGHNGESTQSGGTAITFLRINDLSNTNWFMGSATTEHELGHQFLGDPFNTNRNFFTNITRDTNIDSRNTFQSMGVSQSGYREGLEPRRYAVPANPDANKPQK